MIAMSLQVALSRQVAKQVATEVDPRIFAPSTLPEPTSQSQYICICKRGMSAGHASGVSAPNSAPAFLYVSAGMSVIIEDGSDWLNGDRS